MQYFKHGRKIHIKESQKGSFTRYCGGNVTQDCINKGKNSPNPAIRKKATFADNARKWKHQWGGTMRPQEEDKYDNNPIDFVNIHIDEESLNPYGKFTFGLPESYDKWYKGKSESQDITQESRYKIAKTIYNQLQAAISKYYPKYSPNQRDNLADYMTRHYVKENGWTVVNYAYGGYGKARNADDWVKGMQKMYPNSMAANNFNAYVEGLKKNINGQMYNSEKPNYYTDLLNSYGGDTVRVGKYLKHIRSIK